MNFRQKKAENANSGEPPMCNLGGMAKLRLIKVANVEWAPERVRQKTKEQIFPKNKSLVKTLKMWKEEWWKN